MARKPVCGCNKGLARTTVNGKLVYLGEYKSPLSKAAFDKIIAEWEAAHVERKPSVNIDLKVTRLAVLFLKFAEVEYVRDGKPTGEIHNFRMALRNLNNGFHGVRVIDFGPKKLKLLQTQLVAAGYSQVNVAARTPTGSCQKHPPVASPLKPKNISSAIRLKSFPKALIAKSAFTIAANRHGESSVANPSICDTTFAICLTLSTCRRHREFATVAANSERKSY